jgi:hypothetical protein
LHLIPQRLEICYFLHYDRHLNILSFNLLFITNYAAVISKMKGWNMEVTLAFHVAAHVLKNPGHSPNEIPRCATLESVTRASAFLEVLQKQRLVLMPELSQSLGVLFPMIGHVLRSRLEVIRNPGPGGSLTACRGLPNLPAESNPIPEIDRVLIRSPNKTAADIELKLKTDDEVS